MQNRTSERVKSIARNYHSRPLPQTFKTAVLSRCRSLIDNYAQSISQFNLFLLNIIPFAAKEHLYFFFNARLATGCSDPQLQIGYLMSVIDNIKNLPSDFEVVDYFIKSLQTTTSNNQSSERGKKLYFRNMMLSQLISDAALLCEPQMICGNCVEWLQTYKNELIKMQSTSMSALIFACAMDDLLPEQITAQILEYALPELQLADNKNILTMNIEELHNYRSQKLLNNENRSSLIDDTQTPQQARFFYDPALMTTQGMKLFAFFQQSRDLSGFDLNIKSMRRFLSMNN